MDLGLHILSDVTYGFSCPVCNKLRNYDKKASFVKAKKNNAPCVSCSNSIKAGKCKICEKELHEEIHIDHNHTTGKVRGILCGKCNKGLGQFNDNIEFLTNAINYLKNE